MKNKVLSIFILLLFCFLAHGQNIKSEIIGSWIKAKAFYNSGEELPLNHALNQSYFRFEFKTNGKVFKSVQPLDNGYIFDYSIFDHSLKIGFINYSIARLSNDTLVLVEEGNNGFNDTAIKFVLIPERDYQNNIPLTSEMVISTGEDSLFIECEKIRAYFNKDESFHEFLSNNMPEYSNVVSSDNFFMATFIISSSGSIDSINILRGINKFFDNQFVKAVSKSIKYWKPARLNDKSVDVLHTETFQFISNPKFEKQYYNYRDGVISMQRGDFLKAIDFFNETLNSDSEDKEALYQRGICYLKLNQYNKACSDWKRISELKSDKANNLIKEFCK